MKHKSLNFLFVVIVCFSCSGKEKRVNVESDSMSTEKKVILQDSTLTNSLSQKSRVGGLVRDYELMNRLNESIGSIYIKPIDSLIFSQLFILKESGVTVDTLYKIEENRLFNPEGLDVKVNGENHYGYRFVLKKNNYFVIIALNDEGNGVSDNINIMWNEKKKLFEVLKTP
ncbi:hypothetical protein SAMN04488029_4081 [Reichenbachiella faecimaris]|uniref:Uncharacterized protein n=1 Tax=Reichenbachiella faecimaris TaxID=692418 RepID=A0A1W2GRM5_REIFA|nr:hypothetical protein [Reichenbachiella faecimaris]SMD39289.1 hypothetical protein SAMN04488029_4081 [Reichenbachiella faecimaris]